MRSNIVLKNFIRDDFLLLNPVGSSYVGSAVFLLPAEKCSARFLAVTILFFT